MGWVLEIGKLSAGFRGQKKNSQTVDGGRLTAATKLG